MPQSYHRMSCSIGEKITLNNKRWFLVNFYGSEGSIGIGGLGLFDETDNRLGVIRHNTLMTNGGGLLTNYGDTLIIATNQTGEYGHCGDQGIVLIDLKRGLLANILNNFKGYYGTYNFLSQKIINDHLWLSTERSIIEWNIKKNKWKEFVFEKLIAKSKVDVYRRPLKYKEDYSYNTLYDSIIKIGKLNNKHINVYWPQYDLTEIPYTKNVYGWISRQKYDYRHCFNIHAFLNNNEIIYSDSTLKIPFSTFSFGRIDSIRTYNNAIFVKTNSAWIKTKDVEPLIEEIKCNQQKIVWENISSNKDVAETAKLMYDIEQQESVTPITIVDTILVITDTTNLYDDDFFNLIRIRWLPSQKSYNNVGKKGICLNDEMSIFINNNQPEYNGNKLSMNDTITIVSLDATFTYNFVEFVSENNLFKSCKFYYKVTMKPSDY